MGLRGMVLATAGTWLAWANVAGNEVGTTMTITGLLLSAIGFLVLELRAARAKRDSDTEREERLAKALEDIASQQATSHETLEKISGHLDENFLRMWEIVTKSEKWKENSK